MTFDEIDEMARAQHGIEPERHFSPAELRAMKPETLTSTLYRWCNTTRRPRWLCHGLEGRPNKEFWPLFHHHFSDCDDTWNWAPDFQRMMAAAGAARPFMDAAQGQFFDALPELVTIYRGCSRARVRGLSWTTSQEVASQFAWGHRGIRVPNPVLASAIIPKELIFTVFTDRDEAEVIVPPKRLRKLSVAEYTGDRA